MKKYAILLLLAASCNSGETITTTEIEQPISRIIEYSPAPGQFINNPMAGFDRPVTTPAEAVAYAERRLAIGGNPDPNSPSADYGYVSLGGWGGTIVAQFDTPVPNTGGYELYVTGNSFDGSSEPGIVWVAQKEGNGPGTWYELRGSEYDNTGSGDPARRTTHGYEVTYTPQADGSAAWTDNQSGSGSIARVPAHRQESYVPAWVPELTYRGTRLRDNVTFDQTKGVYVMESFMWGYADNASTVDRAGMKNRFKISNAVDADGLAVRLAQIDYIKVQTGVNCRAENGVGEISTEVCGIGCYRIVTKTE